MPHMPKGSFTGGVRGRKPVLKTPSGWPVTVRPASRHDQNTPMKIELPPITEGPWRHGVKAPYVIATTRPDGRCTELHTVTWGTPTGGLGWPDAMDPQNPHGLTPDAMEANARAIAALPELLQAIVTAAECPPPDHVELYDEEGVPGFRWTHPDGREWTEIDLFDGLTPAHSLIIATLEKAGCIITNR